MDAMRAAPPGAGPSNWHLIRRMLALTWRYRLGCVRVVALQVAMLAFSLGGLGVTGLTIDAIRHRAQPDAPEPMFRFGLRPPAEWSSLKLVGVMSLTVLALAALYALIRYAEAVYRATLVQRVVVDLRSAVYDKLQRLSFRFFDGNDSGSIINRVTTDVQAVRMFVEGVIVEVLGLIVSLTFYLAYMLSIHVPLTLACLATTPVLWVITVMFSRKVRPAYRRNRELHDRMINTLSENLQGVHVVKGFARQREQIARFHAANEAVQKQQQSIFWRVAMYAPTVELLTHVNLLVLLTFGGYLVMQRQIELGQGLVVFAAILRAWSTNVQSVANIANSVQRSLTGAQRVFAVLDEPVEVRSPENAKRLPRAKGAVRFENVTFGYNPDAPVLHDINLDVKPGQCIAVLGATGSGKSTLLSLIPRFYDPQRGRVLLDGIDVRELDLDDLRRNVGLVFQESFLFSTTVAANIAFGNPEATQEQIERAARIACAHDFIMELPHGYDTIIGENGVDLSGGQRQRLAIARAILLEPAILLLDDPTAAVDADTEHQILEAMDRAMEGRTTFVIAHRLSTLRRADLVVVLKRGRIVQMGTHAELLRTSGHYRDVALLQIADMESTPLLDEPIVAEALDPSMDSTIQSQAVDVVLDQDAGDATAP